MNIAIVKRGLGVALVLAGLSPIACGSDSKTGSDTGKDKGTGGSSTDEGTGGSTSTPKVDAGPPPPAGSVPCGSTNCVVPEGSTAMPCCKSAFESQCGQTSPIPGGGCVDLPPATPKGCNALPNIPLFPLVPCCTAKAECGIDLSMFQAGCLNYADAKTFGDMNTPKFDAGALPGGGMLSGAFNIMLPAEAMCADGPGK